MIKNEHQYTRLSNIRSVASNKKIVLLCTLLVICFGYYYYRIMGKEACYDSLKLMELVESVIGMPYHQEPHYKNDSKDIKRLNKDEWLALPYHDDKRYKIIMVEDELNLMDNLPSAQEAQHAFALGLGFVPAWGHDLKDDIFNKLCPHFLLCSAMAFTIQDYVLEQPELLRNIIKIAEKPCNYVKDIDDTVKEGEEIAFKTRYIAPGLLNTEVLYAMKYTDLKDWIKDARTTLQCDRRGIWKYLPTKYDKNFLSKKYVIIKINKTGSIFTAENQEAINIVVRRKDI